MPDTPTKNTHDFAKKNAHEDVGETRQPRKPPSSDQMDNSSTHDPRIEALESELKQRISEVAQLRRSHALERSLDRAGVVDVDAAMALIERDEAALPDDGSDPSHLVEALRTKRPYLFKSTSTTNAKGSVAMSPHVDRNVRASSSMESIASEARATGDRHDLLRYLRLRRHYRST